MLEKSIDIRYAENEMDAARATRDGYVPVECHFNNGHSSVSGKYMLASKGLYEGERPLSIRANELASNGTTIDKFLVTGKPDCDKMYSIAVLSGNISPSYDEALAVTEFSRNPSIIESGDHKYDKIAQFYNTIKNYEGSRDSTLRALNDLVQLYR